MIVYNCSQGKATTRPRRRGRKRRNQNMELLKLERENKKLEEIRNSKENETKKQIKTILQKNNIKIAFFQEVAHSIVEVWNQNEGKQAGEKTRQKIAEEIEQIFDNKIFVYVFKSEYYPTTTVTVTTKDKTGKYTGNEKITIISNNINLKPIDQTNKINKIKIEELREQDAITYVDDLDKTANEIIELHKQAEQKQNELNAICEQIRKLSNFKINAVAYTNTVSHWLV